MVYITLLADKDTAKMLKEHEPFFRVLCAALADATALALSLYRGIGSVAVSIQTVELGFNQPNLLIRAEASHSDAREDKLEYWAKSLWGVVKRLQTNPQYPHFTDTMRTEVFASLPQAQFIDG